MCRNILGIQKSCKYRTVRTREEADYRNLHISQVLGLCALVFALFFALIGLICSCIGFCRLSVVSVSAEPAARRSARFANSIGFLLSFFMLCGKLWFLIYFLKFQ